MKYSYRTVDGSNKSSHGASAHGAMKVIQRSQICALAPWTEDAFNVPHDFVGSQMKEKQQDEETGHSSGGFCQPCDKRVLKDIKYSYRTVGGSNKSSHSASAHCVIRVFRKILNSPKP